jgi:hypothetical protein
MSDKDTELVLNAKTFKIIEWKGHKPQIDWISKNTIDTIKKFFKQPYSKNKNIIAWEGFIQKWNERNKFKQYDEKYKPPWWNEKT